MKQLLLVCLLAPVLTFSTNSFGKGKPGTEKPPGPNVGGASFNCFIMLDKVGDAIRSDGLGRYCDPWFPWGDDNVSAWIFQTHDRLTGDFVFASNETGNFEPRAFNIDLSDCIAGPCTAPFVSQLQPLIFDSTDDVNLNTLTEFAPELVSVVAHYPIAGAANGEELWLIFGGETNTPLGDVSCLCGGTSDRVTITRDDQFRFLMESKATDSVCAIVSVETGHGKNKSRTNTYVGHYHIPMSMLIFHPGFEE